MDDPHSRPPVADDTKLLARLSELERAVVNRKASDRSGAGGSSAADHTPVSPVTNATPAAGSVRRVPLPPSMPSPFEALMERRAKARRPATGYMAFYGLHDPPFELSSDPRFFFHSTPHDHVAQQLLTAIRNREGMAVLTGDEGMGKTTLCRAVMEQLDRRTLTSLVTDPFISGEGLLEKVLADFGVMSQDELSRGPNATRDDLSSTLKSFLESLAALDAAAVVIIDDAHELPRDVLELICRLSEPGSRPAPPQIVLVGKPSLRALLQRSEHRRLNERVKVWCHLGPLPEDELGAYLVHRLAVAGNAPRVRFDDSGLAYLHRISKGVPRVANLVCDRALVRGFEASAHLVDRALIQKAEADLNLGRPRSASRSVLALMAAGVLFVLLVLAGGAAAAWVFQDAVSRGITRWERVPPPPRPPSRKLPLPARAGESVRVGDSVQAR